MNLINSIALLTVYAANCSLLPADVNAKINELLPYYKARVVAQVRVENERRVRIGTKEFCNSVQPYVEKLI